MRYLAFALGLALLLVVARSAIRIEGYMAGTIARVLPVTGDDVNTITYTAPLSGGTTLTYTTTQRQGETDDQFAARAAATWATIKAANGL